MVQLTTPQPARHPSPTVKARKLAYLVFERPDLDKAERFLTDFGLHVALRSTQEVYLRAADASRWASGAIQAPSTRSMLDGADQTPSVAIASTRSGSGRPARFA